MNISDVLEAVDGIFDKTRKALEPIPATMLLATAARRPGFSETITSAEISADMVQNEYDDTVKAFICNVVDKIKTNMQDDSVCFIAIPPNELKFKLMGANAMGPFVLDGTNTNFVFIMAIIR